MIFILGIIVGLLLATFLAILSLRFQTPIHRTMTQLTSKAEQLLGKDMAYVAGLSEEESKFMEGLPANKQVEIL